LYKTSMNALYKPNPMLIITMGDTFRVVRTLYQVGLLNGADHQKRSKSSFSILNFETRRMNQTCRLIEAIFTRKLNGNLSVCVKYQYACTVYLDKYAIALLFTLAPQQKPTTLMLVTPSEMSFSLTCLT